MDVSRFRCLCEVGELKEAPGFSLKSLSVVTTTCCRAITSLSE